MVQLLDIETALLHFSINELGLNNKKIYIISVYNNCVIPYLINYLGIKNDYLIEILLCNYNLRNKITVRPENYPQELCNFTNYVKNGYFILKINKYEKYYFVYNLLNLTDLFCIISSSNLPIFILEKEIFYKNLEFNFRIFNLARSKYLINWIYPDITAKDVNYRLIIASIFIFFILTIYYSPLMIFIYNNLLYFWVNIFRLSLILASWKIYFSNLENTSFCKLNYDIPVYTILVPLYQETKIFSSLLNAIMDINYPKNKLDVKFIIEEDDLNMIKTLAVTELPFYIQIIRVPYSVPRTKPKAMNYALNYAFGKYVTVYDAEDKPDKNQLRTALNLFNNLPDHYICLQAKLNFYNHNSNLLTKCFSIEYTSWFEFFILGLEIFDIPIPLGGSSNHFKTIHLRNIGAWDAYNVTEDADLGIRLHLNGYRAKIFDSYTMEEAPDSLRNWFNQRSRWIKGFFQTFIVFLYNNNNRNCSSRSRINIGLFLISSSYCFLFLPWLIFLAYFLDCNVYKWITVFNSLIALIIFYVISCSVAVKNNRIFGKTSIIDVVATLLWPFYFILHSFASYKALWEILTKPFYWNKTSHGPDIEY